MPTSRLADRQIRAAASRAALRLDVRGPVSKALGNAGIAVTPADLEGVNLDAPVLEVETPTDRAPEPRVRPRGLKPKRKPFKSDPWPTRRATSRAEPIKALSGLTVDERRVHRILIDTLEIRSQSNGGLWLTYADRKRLEALDLALIDKKLSDLQRNHEWSARFGWLGGVGSLLITVGIVVSTWSRGDTGTALALGLALGLMVVVGGAIAAAYSGSGGTSRLASPDRKIYLALRELALLVNDTPVSAALDRADLLIDQLADADEASSRPARRIRTHS